MRGDERAQTFVEIHIVVGHFQSLTKTAFEILTRAGDHGALGVEQIVLLVVVIQDGGHPFGCVPHVGHCLRLDCPGDVEVLLNELIAIALVRRIASLVVFDELGAKNEVTGFVVKRAGDLRFVHTAVRRVTGR